MRDIEYDPNCFEETGGGVNRILVCRRCGATVSFCLTTLGFAYDIHDKWHEHQRRVADDASWGGLNRPIGGH